MPVLKTSYCSPRITAIKSRVFSITYGAGGSTRERTLAAIEDFNGKGTPVAPHLSCIGDDKTRIAELLDLYKAQGIDRIVALRGDLPSGQVGLGELPYAQDLVRFIREHSGDHFHIEVAAYPEMHPQAESLDSDIQRFIEKYKLVPMRELLNSSLIQTHTFIL